MSDPQAGEDSSGEQASPREEPAKMESKAAKSSGGITACMLLLVFQETHNKITSPGHTPTHVKAQSDLTAQRQGSGPASYSKTEGLRTGVNRRDENHFEF